MTGESQEPEVPTGASTGDSQTPRKSKSQVGQLWEEFGNPKEPSNSYGTYNSAPGKPTEPTVMGAIKSMPLANITSFYKAPCARDSLLIGMGSAFGIGGVKAITGGGTRRALWAASNWAVGSFVLAAAASHQFCQRKRKLELEGVKTAQVMMEELKQKKLKEQEEAKRAAQKAEEEERRRKSWTNLSNYKFW